MTKVAAKELTGGDVQFISLVNRGANRDPFRIVKGDGVMIDLARVFKFGGDKAKTGIAFVAVSKSVSVENAKALVEKAGFSIENMVEQDAGHLFVQEGFSESDVVVVYRASDDIMIGLATPNVEKITKGYESYNWQSTDFGEVLSTEQTIPMFHVAVSALTDTFYNSLQKAETPEEARASVQKMLEDFKAHVMDVLSNVPVTAFKLETVLADFLTVEKTDDKAPGEGAETEDDKDKSEVEKTDDETGDDADKDKDKSEVEKTEDEDTSEDDDTVTTDDEDGDAEEVEKGMGAKGGKGKLVCEGDKPGMSQDAAKDTDKSKKKPAKKADEDEPSEAPAWAAQLLKSVEDTKASVASVATEVADVKKTVGSLGTELEETKANIAKVDTAMGLGVIGGETGEDTKTITQKSDGTAAHEDDGFVNFDTAFGDPFADEDK